jgi:hypothetical protein
MGRRLAEVLQTFGGYGFHIYDDRGAPWITISYATNSRRNEFVRHLSRSPRTRLV